MEIFDFEFLIFFQVMAESFHSGPLPFITISDSGECRVEEYAAKVLSQIKGRIAVISMTGMYRSGKSFLLNRLMGGQEGFAVGPSVNACTRGIWIWGQPVELADDYYAILMDTEGLGNFEKKNDQKILSLSILLSSFLVLNTTGVITEDTIDQLAVFSKIASSIKGTPLGCSLLWVLRDFGLKLQDEFGTQISPTEYLENCLHGQQNRDIKEAIKEMFPTRDCFTLVRPAENEVDLRQINKVPFNSLRPSFQNQIEKFVEKVYTSIEPKMVADIVVNGPLFVQLAAQYCSAVSSSVPLVSVLTSAWSNLVSLQLKGALREAVSIYRSTLNNEGMQKLPLSDAQLKLVHLKAKALAKASFPVALLRSGHASSSSGPEGDDQVNQSISIADVGSPDMFYREFRLRRKQLLEHLISENRKISFVEMQNIFSNLSNSLQGIQLVNTLNNQCAKYPVEVYCECLSRVVLPKLVQSNAAPQIVNLAPLASSRVFVAPSPNIVSVPDNSEAVMASLASMRELLLNGLTEMKSAELDIRARQSSTENDQKLIELERKFHKQLNEARRKNEMLIDDLKANYENEVSELRDKKNVLEQRISSSLEELEKAKLIINEQTLRTNFGNVINQQSELILQFLKSGLSASQGKSLETLTQQFKELKENRN